jgi:D-alanyl-D-alanine carboxypeptidase (penicillin-binding protein 5/6)
MLFRAAALFLAFSAVVPTVQAQQRVVAPINNGAVVAPQEPTCVAYIVLDLKSNRVLAAKNPDMRMFPASTTKMMTALVASQRGDLNQVIVASKEAAATGESSIGLLAGENHPLHELLRAAMIKSANDSCVSIADGLAGTEQKFVGWMNEKAKSLGLKNTHFMNPHGLHHPDHYTTARDLAQIGRAYTEVPFLNEIAKEKRAIITGNWKIGGTRLLLNHNKLLYRWPLSDGLKTGYTRQAGNCLVATATKIDPATGKSWRLLAVVLKSRPSHSFPDAQMILERAFASYKPQFIAKAGEVVWNGKIKGGAFPLEATTANGIELPLLANEQSTLQRKIEIFDLAAPIKKGQFVGRVVFSASSRPITAISLRARDDVPETLLSKTIPSVGHRVSFWPTPLRIGFIGVLCGSFAFLLLGLRNKRQRRRKKRHLVPHHSFKTAKLPDRDK